MTADVWLAGVDEVGRGALFGPVVAAAVLMPASAIEGLRAIGVKDSKQLSPRRRQQLVTEIKALVPGWHISFASVPEIERFNIRQASLLAMARALQGLPQAPDHCWIDGQDQIPLCPWPQTPLVRGDQQSPLIAAASILAKVWRDDLMIRVDQRFPGYALAANKGYGTIAHRQAIQDQGLTPLHRRHFCRRILIAGADAARE
ncbi:ribonuclease HII [Synechocystis sp. LKSZ1]|uniref:ribonuclease HII n=1 Tax=Synechocystis sp. LKSZ1 TaxID=3144951 RepID=UPI00336BCDCD